MKFNRSEKYTLGVELEFQIVDAESYTLKPLGTELFLSAPKILQNRLAQEFLRSILEVKTGVCFSMTDVENDLLQTCSYAEELAAEKDCLLFAASLHPFSLPKDQILTDNDRYVRILEDLQYVGREFMAQGLHVHVGLPDGDTAIRVCNVIQVYLPLLLAMSASSPYFKGEDTGMMSYRSKLFEVLPLAGMYENFNDWSSFSKAVNGLEELGVIDSLRDLWWDIRPNPGFGTIEIRICDLPIRFSDVLGIVAMIQALVAVIAEDKGMNHLTNRQLLQYNKWQAARYGLEGSFIDPGVYLKGKSTMSQAIQGIYHLLKPMSIRLGSEEYLSEIEKLLKAGSGATRMKEFFSGGKCMGEGIKKLQREFWQ